MADPVTLGVLVAGAGVAATAFGACGTICQAAYDVHKDRKKKRKEGKENDQTSENTQVPNDNPTAAAAPSFQQQFYPMYAGQTGPGNGQAEWPYGYTVTTVNYAPASMQNGYAIPATGYPQQLPFGYAMPAQTPPSGYPGHYAPGAVPVAFIQGQAQPPQSVPQGTMAISYNMPPPRYETAVAEEQKQRMFFKQ